MTSRITINHNILNALKSFCYQKDSRFVLQHILVECKPGSVRYSATDGKTLVVVKDPIANDENSNEFTFLLHSDLLKSIGKPHDKKLGTSQVRVNETRSKIMLVKDDTTDVKLLRLSANAATSDVGMSPKSNAGLSYPKYSNLIAPIGEQPQPIGWIAMDWELVVRFQKAAKMIYGKSCDVTIAQTKVDDHGLYGAFVVRANCGGSCNFFGLVMPMRATFPDAMLNDLARSLITPPPQQPAAPEAPKPEVKP